MCCTVDSGFLTSEFLSKTLKSNAIDNVWGNKSLPKTLVSSRAAFLKTKRRGTVYRSVFKNLSNRYSHFQTS